MEWEVVIGLEIHAQLATRSKIFSGASTAYGAAPNTQACAVDLGKRTRGGPDKQNNQNPEKAAVHHDLERIEFKADLSSGHGHRCERSDRPGHPEPGPHRDGKLARHAWTTMSRRMSRVARPQALACVRARCASSAARSS